MELFASKSQHGVVLVGDDDNFTLGLMSLLETAGVTVRMAVSARMALAELDHGGMDVVLCDLGASRMQAVELALALRARDTSPPIVAISSMPNIAQHCQALGVSFYLPQPFRFRELLDVLDKAVEHGPMH
jgi:DNA-binding response OmpR family regulator